MDQQQMVPHCVGCRKPLMTTIEAMGSMPALIPGAMPGMPIIPLNRLYCQWPTCPRYGLDTVLFLAGPDMTKFSADKKNREGNQP